MNRHAESGANIVTMVVLLIICILVAVGWYVDRSRLSVEIEKLEGQARSLERRLDLEHDIREFNPSIIEVDTKEE